MRFCDCCVTARVVDPDAHGEDVRQKDKFRECFRCTGCNLSSCPQFYTTLQAYKKHHGTDATADSVVKVRLCPECYSESHGYMKSKPFCDARGSDSIPGMKFGKKNGHVAMKIQYG